MPGGKQEEANAIIRDGLMLFSAEDLSNTKPMVKEDQEEFALPCKSEGMQ
jgi:hypothetical protein